MVSGMLRSGRVASLALALIVGGVGGALAAEKAKAPENMSWTFEGPFGTFDRAQLQRGFKVYREVCASCHGINKIFFRNLYQEGGPEFVEEAAKTIAADYLVVDGPNADGEMFERPAVLSDRFPPPFPNEQAARAAMGGSYPPDLSVIVKARKNGADYLHALLTGYEDEPADMEMREGMYYNPYFPGEQIAMAPPMSDEQVEYTDGTPMTVEQYAADVTAFLMWAAEPKMEERKRIGLQVMLFLVVFASLLYFTKQKIWRDVEH